MSEIYGPETHRLREMLKQYIDKLPNDTLTIWYQTMLSRFVDQAFDDMVKKMWETKK